MKKKRSRIGNIRISGSKDRIWGWRIDVTSPLTTIKPEQGVYSSKASALRAARYAAKCFGITDVIITYHVGI